MVERTAQRKIYVTRDYRLFERSAENRIVDLARHKRLRDSMRKNGWIPSMPMSCLRNGNNRLIVKDGQHRLAIAEELSIPVYWADCEVDFCISEINTTSVTWKPRDHAEKHAANGLKAYQEGLDFADQHKLSIGIAFALLSGTTSFGNIDDAFFRGTFRVKDRAWADRVGMLYSRMCGLNGAIRNMRFTEACMAVCRLKEFDPERMISCAERCREKLVSYSTREAYLDLLEEVYNFGRKSLVPLKMPAIEAMRKRSAVEKGIAAKAAKAVTP